MGAFMVFDIKFKTKEDRQTFEKKYKVRKKDILVDITSPCYGVAWTMLRDVDLNPVYFMGFMGYAEPKEVLIESIKEKIGIKFLAWIPINDKQAEWEKIRGRW